MNSSQPNRSGVGKLPLSTGFEARKASWAWAACLILPALLADLEVALRLVPNNPRTVFELGENYRRLSFGGDDDWRKHAAQSIRWLELALRLNPYDAHAPCASRRPSTGPATANGRPGNLTRPSGWDPTTSPWPTPSRGSC